MPSDRFLDRLMAISIPERSEKQVILGSRANWSYPQKVFLCFDQLKVKIKNIWKSEKWGSPEIYRFRTTFLHIAQKIAFEVFTLRESQTMYPPTQTPAREQLLPIYVLYVPSSMYRVCTGVILRIWLCTDFAWQYCMTYHVWKVRDVTRHQIQVLALWGVCTHPPRFGKKNTTV